MASQQEQVRFSRRYGIISPENQPTVPKHAEDTSDFSAREVYHGNANSANCSGGQTGPAPVQVGPSSCEAPPDQVASPALTLNGYPTPPLAVSSNGFGILSWNAGPYQYKCTQGAAKLLGLPQIPDLDLGGRVPGAARSQSQRW